MRILSLLSALLVVLLLPAPGWAADISNPLTLMFVADARDNVIDVIDLDSRETVFRIETKYPVDDVVVTPFAPGLGDTNIERKLARRFANHMDRISAEYDRRLSSFHTRDSRPLLLYVFDGYDTYRKFMWEKHQINANNTAGMFFSTDRGDGLFVGERRFHTKPSHAHVSDMAR